MTVVENVAFALNILKLNKEQKNEKGRNCWLVGLADRAEINSPMVSGRTKSSG